MDYLKEYDVIKILLKDRTTNKNIIWANEKGNTEITKDDIKHIKPRAFKHEEEKLNRTRKKAEVFTPTFILKEQIDLVDNTSLSLKEYANRKWLEIACGEAPYMVNRYDAESGKDIELEERIGFIDRKFKKTNMEVDKINIWSKIVEDIYKTSFGFEWNGDSLFIARVNLLYTFIENYLYKWDKLPALKDVETIADIISYNIFQMDGLTYTIPLDENTPVKIKNWENNEMELFKSDKNNSKDKN